MKKLKKGFTLIEMLIVVSVLWLIILELVPTISSFNNSKTISYLTSIKQCNFIKEDVSKNVVYCYYDRNNNNRLDPEDISTKNEILFRHNDLKLLNYLNLQDWKYYFNYKKKYLFEYDPSNDKLSKETIIY